MESSSRHYVNPPDWFLTFGFASLFIIGMSFGLWWFLDGVGFVELILTFLVLIFIEGIAVFQIIIFILLRPIKIQIDEQGVILFYHFRKPVYVTWDMIEWVSRTDLEPDSIMNKINRGGKMKVRFHRYPFFMPFEVAKAIMEAYKGNGRLRVDGRNSIIE